MRPEIKEIREEWQALHKKVEDLVTREPMLLGQLPFQDQRIIMAAVKENGLAIAHAKYQSKEACEAAIRQSPDALACIVKKTQALILLAVELDGMALRHAVKETWGAKHTKNIRYAAVRQNPAAIQYIEPNLQTPVLCVEAVERDGMTLGLMCPGSRTEMVCREAVKQNPAAAQFIDRVDIRAKLGLD